MPKTTFSDTPPLGTIVTAAFLNAINNQRHTGEAVDGAGALDYAPDAGAANAYAITLSPVLTGHVTGMPIYFKALNANTGASTLNVNGLGAVAIKKHGSLALAAGDIAAGQIVAVAYDGTNYQILGGGDSISSSLVSPGGYLILPSGNSTYPRFILQWGGLAAGSVNANNVATDITYPITFPNAVLQCMATYSGPGETTACLGTFMTSTSQLRLYNAYSSGLALRWLAWGY